MKQSLFFFSPFLSAVLARVRHKHKTGFTLIELIIVFSVISLLSTVGIAAFVRYNRSQILQQATADVNTMLLQAKSNAQAQVKSNCLDTDTLVGYRVEFCKLSGASCIDEQNDYEMQAVCRNGGSLVAGKKLPPGIQFNQADMLTNAFLFNVITGAVTGASPDGSRVALVGADNMQRTIYIYATGRVAEGETETITPTPTPSGPVDTPTPTPPIRNSAFGGTAWTIPGRIEMENYDNGGQNSGYYDATAGNQGIGGYRTTESVDVSATTDSGTGSEWMVTRTSGTEWLRFTTNVLETGIYTLQIRLASTGVGRSLSILDETAGTNLTGSLSVASTGGGQTWTTITVNNVSLSAGEHVLRVIEASPNAGGRGVPAAIINYNYIEFVYVPPTPTPSPTPTAPPTPTPTPTIQTSTFQVAASADDADNQDGFNPASSNIWVGTKGPAGSETNGYTGFRFTNLPIPQNANIITASLQLYVPSNNNIRVAMNIYAEDSANSSPFSSNTFATRPPTSSILYDQNNPISQGLWTLPVELKTIIKQVVDRPDWQQGNNSLSIIFRGIAGAAWARVQIASFDAPGGNAARLTVTYQ